MINNSWCHCKVVVFLLQKGARRRFRTGFVQMDHTLTHLVHTYILCVHADTYIYIHTHTYTHTYTHAYIHTYIHIYIYTYLHMHTYIHTYIYAYHTYRQMHLLTYNHIDMHTSF